MERGRTIGGGGEGKRRASRTQRLTHPPIRLCIRTDYHIPSFPTHATPINVSVRPLPPPPPPKAKSKQKKKKKTLDGEGRGGRRGGEALPTACVSCVVM